jgi:MT-A70
MPVTELACDDSILWLWVTNANMRHAFTVLDAWGFPRTLDPHLGEAQHKVWRMAPRPERALHHSSARQAARHPHEPIYRAARSTAREPALA